MRPNRFGDDCEARHVPARLRSERGVPLAPPLIIGLGTGSGFSYVLQDTGGSTPQALAQVLRGLLVAANQDPKLSRVFSTFSAATPSVYLDIDRDKAQVLKVDPSAIFQALQASLGGYYVNDMNLFGRTWQVQVQAEAEDRSSIDDIYRINVRNADGKMIPLRSLVEVRPMIGPQALIRYNNQLRRHGPGQPGAGRLVRPGAGGDGAGGGEHAAARLSRRVDRCLVPGEARRRQDRHHPRLRGAVRLPVPGGAVRELDHSGAGAAVGHDWRRRLLRRHRRRRVLRSIFMRRSAWWC